MHEIAGKINIKFYLRGRLIMLENIWDKIDNGVTLSKEDAIELLNINNASNDFYKLISKANELSRNQYQNKGYIFAQIGINASPCSGNCKFCSLAKDNYSVDSQFEKSTDEIISQVKIITDQNIEALFLMTTADFDKNKFLTIGESVRAVLPEKIRLIANIGDFGCEYAAKLKTIGFSGAYHIVRLREGVDTDIKKEIRINTLNAIKSAELDLYYCVEPIGREHTYDEIADEMIRAREYKVDVMAVMGRVGVKGTPYENAQDISDIELTKITAVTRIVSNPKKSMNVHEPKKTPLLAGVNQLYAEFGGNPRDNQSLTENNRGYDIESVKKLLHDAEYYI